MSKYQSTIKPRAASHLASAKCKHLGKPAEMRQPWCGGCVCGEVLQRFMSNGLTRLYNTPQVNYQLVEISTDTFPDCRPMGISIMANELCCIRAGVLYEILALNIIRCLQEVVHSLTPESQPITNLVATFKQLQPRHHGIRVIAPEQSWCW